MEDLISRSALIEEIRKGDKVASFNYFISLVQAQPTAYDVEKVVAELEEYRANFDCRICKYNKTEGPVCLKDCTDALIDCLFDIVKRGGVDD